LLNRPSFISTFLALLRIGAVAVPTPPLLRSREIAAIVESADPVLMISERDLWDEILKLDQEAVRCVDVESLRGGTPQRDCLATEKDSPAIVLFTSGSTGVPKGCIHSHADLLAVCDTYARHIL